MRPVLYASILILTLVPSIAIQPAYPKEVDFPPPPKLPPVFIGLNFSNSPLAVSSELPNNPRVLPASKENLEVLSEALESIPTLYEDLALPELQNLVEKNTDMLIGSTLGEFHVDYYSDESLTVEVFCDKPGLKRPCSQKSVTNPLPIESMQKVLGTIYIRFDFHFATIREDNFENISPWLSNQTDTMTILATKTIWTIDTFKDELQGTNLYMIKMDMLDERASRITISYVEDGMEHQLTKYWVEQEPPHWVNNSLSINNIIGEPLQKLESGKMMMLTARLHGNTGAGFVHIMQVKNADGVTEQLTWIISEPFDGSWQVSYSFIPPHSGEYTVESFVWRSTQGTPLGDVAEKTITVT